MIFYFEFFFILNDLKEPHLSSAIWLSSVVHPFSLEPTLIRLPPYHSKEMTTLTKVTCNLHGTKSTAP